MKVIDYVLILLVLFLLGYGIYQKRSSNKDQNKYLQSLSKQLQNLQDQLDEIKNKPESNDQSQTIIKEVKDRSENLNSQLELLSEDLASKLEQTEEKINFLMEKEKSRKNQDCCSSPVKIEKKVIYKEKRLSCDRTAKYFECVTSRQSKNLKACQTGKLIQGNSETKTAEINKQKNFSDLETINENITVTRITNPQSKLIIDESCFETKESTELYCKKLVCRQ